LEDSGSLRALEGAQRSTIFALGVADALFAPAVWVRVRCVGGVGSCPDGMSHSAVVGGPAVGQRGFLHRAFSFGQLIARHQAIEFKPAETGQVFATLGTGL
jgi:hypothetical protein